MPTVAEAEFDEWFDGEYIPEFRALLLTAVGRIPVALGVPAEDIPEEDSAAFYQQARESLETMLSMLRTLMGGMIL